MNRCKNYQKLGEDLFWFHLRLRFRPKATNSLQYGASQVSSKKIRSPLKTEKNTSAGTGANWKMFTQKSCHNFTWNRVTWVMGFPFSPKVRFFVFVPVLRVLPMRPAKSNLSQDEICRIFGAVIPLHNHEQCFGSLWNQLMHSALTEMQNIACLISFSLHKTGLREIYGWIRPTRYIDFILSTINAEIISLFKHCCKTHAVLCTMRDEKFKFRKNGFHTVYNVNLKKSWQKSYYGHIRYQCLLSFLLFFNFKRHIENI